VLDYLRKQMGVSVVLESTLLVVAVVGVLTALAQREARRTALFAVEAGARGLSALTEAELRRAMMAGDKDQAQEALDQLAKLNFVKQATVLDPAGKMYLSAPRGSRDPGLRDWLAGQGKSGKVGQRVTDEGLPYTLTTQPMVADSDCRACHRQVEIGAPVGYLALESWTVDEFTLIRGSFWLIGGAACAGVILLAACLALLMRKLFRPMRAVATRLTNVADGDLRDRIAVEGDAVSRQMSVALNQSMEHLGTAFQSFGQAATKVTSSADALGGVNQKVAAAAQQTSSQANIVSNSATAVNKNVQTVAAGAEQMSASIREIARNTAEAAKVTGDAVKMAQSTRDTVQRLGDSSAQIGSVVKMITSIAEQTNLLALNATIEAARAGEAGKGFAVVAGEVKDLARETAKATHDIGARIQAIQSETQAALGAIGDITKVIGQVSDLQREVSAAVEQQTATTSEITRNVSEAARATEEIASNITGVASAAQSTSEGLVRNQAVIEELQQVANGLRSELARYRTA